MENKQQILDLLLPALKATRNLSDLESLEYKEESGDEYVIAKFPAGEKIVNVYADSGTAMIIDIVKQIV